MKAEDYLDLPYHIEITPDALPEDGRKGWFARVRELDGCMTRGFSPDELHANIRNAMLTWIDGAIADGMAVPLPAEEPERSGNLTIRIPGSLHDALAEEAEAQGISLNQLIAAVLAGAVSWRRVGVRDALGDYRQATG